MIAGRRRGRVPGALPLALAAVGGASLSLALPPIGSWPLLGVLVPLFAGVANAESPRAAFGLAGAFAVPFFALYTWWLPASLAVGFGPAAWLILPPLIAVLALFWALLAAVARRLGGRGAGTLWVLPALWVLVEWARAQGYFGFPWGTLGYAWLDTPVAQLASVVGVYGLSLLTTSAAALLAAPLVRDDRGDARLAPRRVAAPALALLLVGGAWSWGALALRGAAPDAPLTALLVQGDIDPFGAVLAGPELRTYVSLTERGADALPDAPDLVVWPEGAVSGRVLEGVRGEPDREAIQASAPASAFLVGGRRREPGRSYNSVFSIADGRLLGTYDKRVLVPFGERFPLIEPLEPVYRGVFALMGLPLLNSTYAGDAFAPLSTPLGSVGTYICYESVFPQSTRLMVARGAEVLVTVTNDAWFSRGDGARQHWDMGRMRAIETRRYVLRAANDGITGAIDPYGRGIVELERGIRGSLVAPFGLSRVRTPWVRVGGFAPWVLTVWVGLAALAASRRRR